MFSYLRLTIIDFASVTGNQAMLREDSMPLGTVKKGNDDHLSVKHLLPKTKVCDCYHQRPGMI